MSIRTGSVSLLLLVIASLATLAVAGPLGRGDDAAVRVPLNAYLEGHATGDRNVMARAFYPDAHLTWVRNDSLLTRSVEDYLAGMSGSPAADEARRRRRIVSVDVAGSVAVGKIELDDPDAHIVDFMTLLERDGEWRISHKSFHVQPKGG